MIGDIQMGDVADFRNFMGAVIDRRAFTRLKQHLDAARQDPGVTVLAGGGATTQSAFSCNRRCSKSRIPAIG